VAPVTAKEASSRKVYLPRGMWYDFWSNEKLQGGQEIERKVDLSTIPIYVRAGSILPLGPVKQYADEVVDGPLTLVVYPGANGAMTLYEDDGKTFNYRKGEFMKVQMTWIDSNRRLNLRLATGSRMLGPKQRPIKVRLAGQTLSRSAFFEGRPIEMRL
jgi:alpha-glucosidase (family GH31 glycosyl hydrolase)